MANRVFVCAVAVLWLGSMSWLMIDKVLPSFHDGVAPIAAGLDAGKPVAWQVFWSGRPVGHAVSVRLPGVLNTTNVDNRVVLEDVPLLDLVPAPLMRHVVGDLGSMKFDAWTRLEFDSLDNFSAFESNVSINDVRGLLSLKGRVDGSFLDIKVNFGDVPYNPKVPIGDHAALSEALFPDATLPYMYVGKQWHEEVYNPFRSPSSPVETVDVEVTGIENIEQNGELERTMRVEFRGPPGPGIPEDARLQAVAWVRAKDGVVLRQDVMISSSKLRFERLTEAASAEIGKTLLSRTNYGSPRMRDGDARRGRAGGRRPYWCQEELGPRDLARYKGMPSRPEAE